MKKLTEENVTTFLVRWLIKNGWLISSIDIPGSGSGIVFRTQNNSLETRGRLTGSIIPDIIAVKNNVCLLFENKPTFVKADFEKQGQAKSSGVFNADIRRYPDFSSTKLLFGIGMPDDNANIQKGQAYFELVDFVAVTNKSGDCRLVYKSDLII